jgi:hypothetical protein
MIDKYDIEVILDEGMNIRIYGWSKNKSKTPVGGRINLNNTLDYDEKRKVHLKLNQDAAIKLMFKLASLVGKDIKNE